MHDDHEKRITAMERLLYGPDGRSELGLVHRAMMTESIALKLETVASRIMWLLIIGILTAVLNLILAARPQPAASGSHQTTSVITSDATKATDAASRKEWLTVQDVANREKLDEHTITNYIARDQIQPPPTKAGKSYQISPSYRIIPNLPEPSRTIANTGP